MKNRYHIRYIVAIAMLLSLMLLIASAKKSYGQIAQSQIVGVSQAIDGTITPAALGGLHVTFTYFNFGTNPVFLNIWARMPGQQNSAWVAMNICLSPFNGTRRLERSISLHHLGIPNNMRIPGLMLAAQQTPMPLINPTGPPPNFSNYNCPLDSIFIFDPPSNEFVGPGGPEYLAPDFAGPIQASVARGCDVPNGDLDGSANPGVRNGYAGDPWGCAPMAVANSLEWLMATIPAVGSDGLTPRQRLEELSELMGRKKRGDGATNQQIIQGKISFCARHKLKVKVEHLGASGNFDEDKAWLQAQYDANQDVELDYTYIDEEGIERSHAVVLTDVNITGRVPQISVKDDKRQDIKGGNTEEKNLELTRGPKGHITFIRDGRVCTVNNMYAESYDPTAGTYTDPNNPNQTTTTFCEEDKNQCKPGACPALVVYYDRAGAPVITYPFCAKNNNDNDKACCDINKLYTTGRCVDAKGRCKKQNPCPDLYRSKEDASRPANPVQGKCDEGSCHCVYEFEAPKNKKNKREMPQHEQLAGKLNIYPNPVTLQMHIEVSGYEGAYHLQVVNMLGQQLIAKSIVLDGAADEYTLDVSALARGLYYVVLRNDVQQLGGTFTKD